MHCEQGSFITAELKEPEGKPTTIILRATDMASTYIGEVWYWVGKYWLFSGSSCPLSEMREITTLMEALEKNT